jgi:two-component system response regulator FixJ
MCFSYRLDSDGESHLADIAQLLFARALMLVGITVILMQIYQQFGIKCPSAKAIGRVRLKVEMKPGVKYVRLYQQIFLIDPIDKRRAAINFDLRLNSLPAEPYCDVSELPVPEDCSGLFLAVDEGDVLDRVLAHVRQPPMPCAVLAIAEQPKLKSVVRAIRSGATDYLDWSTSLHDLVLAIEAAGRNVGLRRNSGQKGAEARRLCSKPSSRERQVLHAVSLGWNSKEIGAAFGISGRTVEIYRANFLIKLNAINSVAAVRVFIDATSVSQLN